MILYEIDDRTDGCDWIVCLCCGERWTGDQEGRDAYARHIHPTTKGER